MSPRTYGLADWVRGQWNEKVWGEEYDAVNKCSGTYTAGEWGGRLWWAVAPGAYLKSGLPQMTIHYTTPNGYVGIMTSGTINRSLGFVGKGVYSTLKFVRNPFLPKKAVVPIIIETTPYTIRIVPRLVYLSLKSVKI